MGMTNVVLKSAKEIFRKGFSVESTKASNTVFGLSAGYTVFNLYKTIDDMKQNKDRESKEDLVNALSGMAAMSCSVFGPLGAIIAGGTIKFLGENAKQSFA